MSIASPNRGTSTNGERWALGRYLFHRDLIAGPAGSNPYPSQASHVDRDRCASPAGVQVRGVSRMRKLRKFSTSCETADSAAIPAFCDRQTSTAANTQH